MKNKTHNKYTFVSFIIGSLFLNSSTYSDAVFEPTTQPISTIAPYVLKTTNLEKGDTKAYRTWFEMSTWQGDLIEYNVTSNGALSTDVTNLANNPPDASGSNWSARATMAAKELSITNYWNNGRKIITSITGTNQQAFTWANLTASQKSEIISAGQGGEKVLNFLRGSRREEADNLRTRAGILGDITSSNPVYVGAPSTGYNTLSGYVDFANTSRSGRIYVGANDGMIHAFDETDGSEVFSYIPSMLFPTIGKLSEIGYVHKNFINSELVASDAQISTTWKTILSGGLGAGAKGMFALDVTNPNLSDQASNTGTNKKILWEKHGKNDSDLGHIYGQSSIVMLSDNKWYVVNGNGYGSTNGGAKLYLVEVGTGTVKKLSTVASTGNGLSTPTLLDTDYDSIADVAYAGDLKGNLWKFDLTDLTKAGTLLFNAGVAKPITVQPEIAQHPRGGYLVYFGTGSLLSEADTSNTDQQSIYAIWDKGTLVTETCGSTLGNLLCQSISASTAVGAVSIRTASKSTVDWDAHRGWKLDLSISGERLLGHPQLRDGRLQFVTTTPGAAETDKSWLIELDYLTGGSSEENLFDVDGSGQLDNGDKVAGKTANALFLGEGHYSQPTIARIRDGVDTLFINGLKIGYTETTLCTGDCANGLAGGHFDLDVDTVLGGETDKHTHQYDDKFNVTYGDYFDLLNGGNKITEVGITAGSQKLLAFVANADLSVGGNLTIGNKTWNVVNYQKMIQKQLSTWDGVSDLLDSDGTPLAFTLDQISSAAGGTGTLRFTFDNTAIITGGLIPTQTSCVKSAPNVTKGHWRNGALTLHVLDYEAVRQDVFNNTLISSRVYSLQTVTDLPNSISTLSIGTIVLKEDTNLDGVIDTEYAGIIANPSNSSAFLYESTLFWHYEGDCYGEAAWEANKNSVTITEQELIDFLANQSILIAELKNYSCLNFTQGVCQDASYISLIDRLKAAVNTTFGAGTNNIDQLSVIIAELFIGTAGYNGLVEASTTPPQNTSQTISNTPGPSFRFGRQTWVEF